MPLERFPQVPFSPPSEHSFGAKDGSINAYLSDVIPHLSHSSFEPTYRLLLSQNRPVVLDLFASAAALRSLRLQVLATNPHAQFKGACVRINDTRSTTRKKYDEQFGISEFEANIASTNAQTQVDRWLNGDLLDLTMSLPYAGFSFIPNTLRFYQNSLKWLLDRTNPDGGIIMLQTPPEEHLKMLQIPMHDCLRKLKKANVEYEYVPTYTSTDLINPDYGLLYVKRHSK